MHCKHCGKQIEEDSMFCSFCGGKIDPIGQTTQILQPIIPQQEIDNIVETSKVNNQNLSNNDKGLLFAFIVMVGAKVFWFFSDLYTSGKDSDIESYINYVLKPSYIVFWSIPLILALYSKRKEQRTILFIISILVICWVIYEFFIKVY